MPHKYDLVIFDVDGTMLDTTEGVISSVKYTIDKFGLDKLSEEKLSAFIGPPIQDSFALNYGLDGEILQELATVFRDRYKDFDLLKAKPYDKIYDVFNELKRNGIKTAVATYKREDYALTLLKHFGFDQYTKVMHGGDHYNKLKKCDIIEKCITESGIKDRNGILMVGDTPNDAIGAEKIGIDFIAVTFGFGFKTEAELNGVKKIGAVGTPIDLLEFIL